MDTFIGKNWKFLLIIGVIIFGLLLQFKGCQKEVEKKDAILSLQKIEDKRLDLTSITEWKDKYNNTHKELAKIKVEKAVLQIYADSIANILNVKSKQIEEITQVKTDIAINKPLSIQKRIDTIYRDSIIYVPYDEFIYKDKWIDIKGDIGKTNSIEINAQDTLTKVDYWKRKWFLGNKTYYSDFSNTNPYVNISGLKQVELDVRTKRWSIGPYIGVGYDINESKPELNVGIGIQYGVLQF